MYGDIGLFYRDIDNMSNEGDDRGMYRKLFDNTLESLKLVSGDEKETAIVKLELLEMARSILQQHSTRLKIDGVSYEETMNMFEIIKTNTDMVSVSADGVIDIDPNEMDEPSKLKASIKSNLESTKKSLDTAYGTTKIKDGGE